LPAGKRWVKMNTRRIAVFIVTAALLAVAAPSWSMEKPLWELGIGGGFLLMPDYRGSNKTRAYVLPYPYAVYRGGIFRVQDNILSGRIFKSDRLTLDASVYGAVPVRSSRNDARAGMEDLDPTFELGPALHIKIFEAKDGKCRLTAALPVRAVFSTDFTSVRYEGVVFAPRLNFEKRDVIAHTGLYAGISAGPMFADSGYHSYFYEVEPLYARIGRSVYSPGGGYSGSTMTVGLGKSYRQLLFNTFISADFLHGAVFEDSPLVKRKISWMGGFSITWVFLKSKTMVHDDSLN